MGAAGLLVLGTAGTSALQAQEPEFLLYGGKGQTQFLGCLNCSRFDKSSVWNKLGPHGSEFDEATIWSKTGVYGSQYSSLSPWHRHSTEAPEIRDRDGKSYGRFTRNQHGDRTKVESLLWILENYDYVIENLNDVRLEY
ncbi:hypothetical protein [Denitrobaculum tricleocarpae]|uniref:Uncharacterized protein n=1 Tax=Denitrobaculum tricleocarpae TaxID=2591009 RepID=A0A545TX55_9PROT|nr:hypothetical protein [Denitrobaculum tricleocarpae]TQV81792.1 hypothetical protein FKG95_06005 [Denitrobaculum tricleocarpae]